LLQVWPGENLFPLNKSRFIYITGCDGTGKSTQAQFAGGTAQGAGDQDPPRLVTLPLLLQRPAAALRRLRGFSWHEQHGDICHGYWDFPRSWAMQRVFPWLLLLDAALAGCGISTLPLWLAVTPWCGERFALDMLVDISLACGDGCLHRRLPGRYLLGLLPSRRRTVILDLDAATIKSRRPNLEWDRILEQRLAQYRLLSADLSIPLLSNRQEISLVRQQNFGSVSPDVSSISHENPLYRLRQV